MKGFSIVLLAALPLLLACSPAQNIQEDRQTLSPPVAKQKPKRLRQHGNTRIDPYYWLRDDKRKDREVLAYLEAENAYAEGAIAQQRVSTQTIYDELKRRVKDEDESVPVREGDYWYSVRYEKGQEHPVYLRRPGAMDADPEVILDVNELAKGFEFYEVEGLTISPDGNLLAYTEDTVSRGKWRLRIRDLRTGEWLEDAAENTSGELAWANDSATLFYVRQQEKTLIPHRVYRHRLGDPENRDDLVYEEKDSTFYLSLDKSRDDSQIVISAIQTLVTEYRAIPADDPTAEPVIFLPREADHEYEVEYVGDEAYIRSNWEAPNFRLLKVSLAESTDKRAWRNMIPHRDDVFLEDFEVYRDYVAVEERAGGLTQLRVLARDGERGFVIPTDEEAFTVSIDNNPSVDTNKMRYEYTSLATPDTLFEIDLDTGERRQLKQDPVIGYDPGDYATRRIYAEARDGTPIPVTLFFKRGVEPDGTNPLYVLGYGSYGASYDPQFNEDRASLADRGFVFALAHIRGGQEMGRDWYEDGKLLAKKNTFYDFIDVTAHLVESGWGAADKVVAAGRSAGGLLMGAVVNMRPDLFSIIATEVPFVDVVTTMLDESIPLTTFEFDEWGNPKDKEYYEYMLSYSPYDQIEAKAYPHIIVSTGLWDPAVQYWEPAKWVAKLRANKTDNNRLWFFVDMDAGHSGQPGRYESIKETAREYAFIFDVLGL